jgi:hypothetical protein
MRRRLHALVAVALLVALGSAANELSDLRSTDAAMACCAKTDYQCAGVATPDDCCQRMHHAPARPAPSTAPIARHAAEGQAVACLPAVYRPFPLPVTVVAISPDVARPHDPPHLHTFSLLI